MHHSIFSFSKWESLKKKSSLSKHKEEIIMFLFLVESKGPIENPPIKSKCKLAFFKIHN